MVTFTYEIFNGKLHFLRSAFRTLEKENSTQAISYTYTKITNFSKENVFRVHLKESITQKRNFYPKVSYTPPLPPSFETTNHLAHLSGPLIKENFTQNYFLYLTKKSHFSNEKIFYIHLKEPIFYMTKKCSYVPIKISDTCPKKTNFPEENNFLKLS